MICQSMFERTKVMSEQGDEDLDVGLLCDWVVFREGMKER